MREYILRTRVPSCLFVRNLVPEGDVAAFAGSEAAMVFFQAPGVIGRETDRSGLDARGLRLAGVWNA